MTASLGSVNAWMQRPIAETSPLTGADPFRLWRPAMARRHPGDNRLAHGLVPAEIAMDTVLGRRPNHLVDGRGRAEIHIGNRHRDHLPVGNAIAPPAHRFGVEAQSTVLDVRSTRPPSLSSDLNPIPNRPIWLSCLGELRAFRSATIPGSSNAAPVLAASSRLEERRTWICPWGSAASRIASAAFCTSSYNWR